jgi:hypothetical protein
MATVSVLIQLGGSGVGLQLKTQIIDQHGNAVIDNITTGFVEIGGGDYLWTYDNVPDNFIGAAKFYSDPLPVGLLLSAPIETGPRTSLASFAGSTLDNAYIDVNGAQSYFDTKLHTEAWDDASDVDKLKALIEATRAIDRLNYVGSRTDPAQLLEFPRNGDVNLPEGVQIACCEIALKLLDDFDIEMEINNLAATNQNYSGVRTNYDRSFVLEHLSAGIPSAVAWAYLKPYLSDPRRVRLVRN